MNPIRWLFPSIDDLRHALQVVSEEIGIGPTVRLLALFGASRVSDVPFWRRRAVISAAKWALFGAAILRSERGHA